MYIKLQECYLGDTLNYLLKFFIFRSLVKKTSVVEFNSGSGFDALKIALYGAFKAALIDILEEVERVRSEGIQKVILIHGVSGVGKSALAQTLLHFLTLVDPSPSFFI